MVMIKPSSDDEFSDLQIELELRWNFTEAKSLGLDLGELLATNTDPALDLDNFKKAAIPAEGEAEFELQGDVVFNLGVGLEYANTTKTITPYLIGATGFTVEFKASGGVEFEAGIGPLKGVLNAEFDFGTSDQPIALKVGLNESINYYLLKPNSTRTNFIYPGGITELTEELDAVFDGRVSANIMANVPLIKAEAEFGVTIPNVNNFILDPKNEFGTNIIFSKNATISGPNIKKPSFLDILLLDPNAIVEALDVVFETTEAASLGPSGIVTTFPAPYVRNAIGNALGAGTPENIIAKARSSVVPSMQETLNAYEEDSDTVAELLGAVIEDVLKDLGLMAQDKNVTVECFQYNATGSETQELDSCSMGDPGSVQWTLDLGNSYVSPYCCMQAFLYLLLLISCLTNFAVY